MIKEQIKILVNLQNIERESATIKSKLNDVSTRMDVLDSRLSAVEGNVENETVQLGNLQKQYREFESDVQLNLSQVQKSQVKLRSIKTNKE